MGSKTLFTFHGIAHACQSLHLSREQLRWVRTIANATSLRMAAKIANEFHRLNSRKK